MPFAINMDLEVFWQGPDSYKGCQVKGLDLKIQRSAQEVYQFFAKIDRNTPFKLEQQLLLAPIVQGTIDPHTRKSIYLPAEVAQLRSIQVMMLVLVKQAEKTHIHMHPIEIPKISKLESRATYQLRLLQQDDTVQASIVKKVHQIARPLETLVQLEAFWTGDSYQYDAGWTIEAVDIKLHHSVYEISAEINTTLPSTDRQQLFITCSNQEKPDKTTLDKKFTVITSSIANIRSIEIAAVIVRRQQPVNVLNNAMRIRREQYPLWIKKMPEQIKAGKTYELRVGYRYDKFQTSLVQKSEED